MRNGAKKALKKSKFKFSYKNILICYSLIIVIILVGLHIYIKNCLLNYEKNDIHNYLTNVVYNIDNYKLHEYTNSKESNIKEEYINFLNDNTLEFKKHTKEDEIYDVCIGDRILYTISLEKGDTVTEFGVLSYKKLSTKEIKPNMNRGIYYYDIEIPSNYKVYLDDKEITLNKKLENYKNLNNIYEFSNNTPKKAKYELNNINKDSKIVIKDFLDNDVKYEIKNNKLIFNEEKYTMDKVKDILKVNINPLEFAKKWSLLMSDDLIGTYHGFYTISNYMVKDSNVYKRAYTWATGIDITFTSTHNLKNPPFTDESVKDCIIYSEDLFSADVYFKKHIRVNSTNIDKTDIFSQRIYFTKINDTWKVAYMTTVLGG